MPYLGLDVAKPAKPAKKKDMYVFLKTSADQVVTDEETDERLSERLSKVANNLTTTEEGFTLDARQGKALNDKIEALGDQVTFSLSGTTLTITTKG